MRENITFSSNGLRCKGWFFTSKYHRRSKDACSCDGSRFLCVTEMGLERYAERFASAGFATLVFDYRHFWESEGLLHGQLFPQNN